MKEAGPEEAQGLYGDAIERLARKGAGKVKHKEARSIEKYPRTLIKVLPFGKPIGKD